MNSSNSKIISYAKDAFICWYIAKWSLQLFRHVRARGLCASFHEIYASLSQTAFRLALLTPSASKQFHSEIADAGKDIRKKVAPEYPDMDRYLSLPEHGFDKQKLEQILEQLSNVPSAHWQDGKVSGAVYHGGKDLSDIITNAFAKFVISNPLHPDVFPGVRKMEAEVVAIVLSMYNCDPLEGAGAMTSGGTESIVMACKTYRDWARDTKGITQPEMVVPVTAHAAFDKAASYFKIKIHHIPVNNETRQVDVSKVIRAINSNTIMIVGSAPNFPDGTIDDIASLSVLAKKYKIGLHVDACLGSFIVPFLNEAGYPIDPFDFRLEGVTSISCDTHKYGFAPKGSSVIMYRSQALRRYQYYVTTSWPGGVYASPSIAGSRPGSLIAGTWAALMSMGKDGYLESCKSIVSSTRKVIQGIKDKVPELEILGTPKATVVAFKSSSVNIYHVADIMSKKGWHLNALQNPPSMHICCTKLTIGHEDEVIEALKDAVASAKENPTDAQSGTTVQLYGIGSSIAAGPTVVKELASIFIDSLYAA